MNSRLLTGRKGKGDPAFLPSLTLKLQLRALASLGLNMPPIEARIGPLPEQPDALVPVNAYLAMWEEAQRQFRTPGLASALAFEIPFGAFGALDYLVGSAATIGAACESAVLFFAMVASDVRLEVDRLDDGTRVLRVRGDATARPEALEFTLACIVHRLRSISSDRFAPLAIGLPLDKPRADMLRQKLYGTPLAYVFPLAEIHVDERAWHLELQGADAYLHATLRQLAEQLGLARPGDTDLEQAVRARLRGTLAQQRATSHRLAELLGVSERTLQRRLSKRGQSFTGLVEEFRREEAARLLIDKRRSVGEVAGLLGYTEQTSFTRAFRRWTGMAPGAWRKAQGSHPGD
jgi:AraC-like DNA-binding protein